MNIVTGILFFRTIAATPPYLYESIGKAVPSLSTREDYAEGPAKERTREHA